MSDTSVIKIVKDVSSIALFNIYLKLSKLICIWETVCDVLHDTLLEWALECLFKKRTQENAMDSSRSC